MIQFFFGSVQFLVFLPTATNYTYEHLI